MRFLKFFVDVQVSEERLIALLEQINEQTHKAPKVTVSMTLTHKKV